MIESLLLATDLSQRSDVALDRALLLTAGAAERIGFLHVIAPEVSALLQGKESDTPPIMDKLLDARLAPDARRPNIRIRKGDPHEEIVNAAEERDDDLIVMGLPRPRQFMESLRGTTLERVIRASARPVLSVRDTVSGPYRRVLVATDLSDISALALKTAQRLGLLESTHITVVYALWPMVPHMVGHGGMTINVMPREATAEKANAIKELRAFIDALDLDPQQMDYLVVEGTPRIAVRKAVADVKPDLVVFGTRGRSGILRMVLGSVAEDLLNWLPIDVLVVPPEPET